MNPKTEQDRTIVRYLLITELRQCFEGGHLVSSPADTTTPVIKFETEALKFAWLMKLQPINYYLEEKSQYNEEEHDLHPVSDDPVSDDASNVIKYYTWPTLKENYNDTDNVISKGVVFM